MSLIKSDASEMNEGECLRMPELLLSLVAELLMESVRVAHNLGNIDLFPNKEFS